MKKEIYVIGTTTNGKGLIIEYKIIERKKDMRFKFCKMNNDKIVSSMNDLKNIINECGGRIKDNRILLPNAELMRKFNIKLQSILK